MNRVNLVVNRVNLVVNWVNLVVNRVNLVMNRVNLVVNRVSVGVNLDAHLGVVELGAKAGDLSPQFEALPLGLAEERRHPVQLSLEDGRTDRGQGQRGTLRETDRCAERQVSRQTSVQPARCIDRPVTDRQVY